MKILRLIIIMFISIFVANTIVYASDTEIFSMTDATGSKNEEITIYINLNKELEFASADLLLEYDTSKLEFINYTNLDIFKKSAMSIVKNNSDTGKIAIGYVSNPNSSDLHKNPGKMLSITFKIKTDDYKKIDLNLKCTSLKTDAGEKIEVTKIQSQILVNQKSSSEIEETTKNENSDYLDNNENSVYNKNESVNILPKTGKTVNIITLSIVICTVISFYFYKKYIDLKEI